MSRADLTADLKASLHDAGDVFVDAGDMDRLVDTASQDFNRHRPRTQLGMLTLIADQLAYPAPASIYLFKSSLWGIAPAVKTKPWERSWPGPIPRVQLVEKELHLTPAPTLQQISILGNEFRYYYFGRHVIDAVAANTTIDAADRGLLILRAQAEAMNELAMRNIKKPVQMRDGLGSAPKNMTPAAWYKTLMDQWDARIQRLTA